ncbi:MAG: hypothetical protein K0Q90_3511, partial [Paenibacillaceae bacterium]|nr:hypothetical protein [Paenibacillaceae bacterium]
EVFQEYEAPDYSKEGVREFKSFIEPGSLRQKIGNNEFWI